MITIQFNGQSKQIDDDYTIDELLISAGVPAKFCAVELNLEIVPKHEYRLQKLKNGDAIEVVTLVGGG
ncbi:MAG: sulfur carrier protein ThiS [Pirellulaceae bacterium]|nr:sulfur carrier protein ThiS [Pirellulaceae bacterium]